MYNNHQNQPNLTVFNRTIGAFKALPEPLKVISGFVGILGLATVCKGVKGAVKSWGKKNTPSETVNEALPTVKIEPIQPLNKPLIDEISDEDIEKELTRRVMSNLGKRSVEARRRKRLGQ